MSDQEKLLSNYLFEVSWEVCNKLSGIHTVLATKSVALSEIYGDKHIFIGPDVWREANGNPEFSEDFSLFAGWKKSAADNGLRVRVGRWNIPTRPITILVDFTELISKKDKIFAKLWEEYKLDSLSGQWDYIDPALFGYASGIVIESFISYNLQPKSKFLAHFHEWMSGAGVLYIKQKNLSIGTIYTTHATALGRAMAINNLPLYDSMATINPAEVAKQLGIYAKYSMDRAVAYNADVFTTVSDISAKQCEYFIGKKVDIITPNGIEDSLIPSQESFSLFRENARKRILQIASAMHNVNYDNNTIIIGISGRYEVKSKGIDVFLDSLERLNSNFAGGKRILACIMVPAWNKGVNKELLAKVNGDVNFKDYTTCLTHVLGNTNSDIILNKLKSLKLSEACGNLSVMFVPSYLNGSDGLFNVPYYNLLCGFDLTIFPSYYEPWGYTPMESLAFGVPTITTSLSGFGVWVRDNYKGQLESIKIIERNDTNYNDVVDGVISMVNFICNISDSQKSEIFINAREISRTALWNNNIKYYAQAYIKAMEADQMINGDFPHVNDDRYTQFENFKVLSPQWRQVLINKNLPDRLQALDVLSKNLWWCWNQNAIDLFKNTDLGKWIQSNGNPIAMLDLISLKRYNELALDEQFLEQMDAVYADFNKYMEQKSNPTQPSISYFCMEYGLDTSLKIYSGGLGILAGDYLKEASDMNVNMTAVGFLYKYGYFTQQLSAQGDQVATYDEQDFSKTPAVPVMDKDNNWVKISLSFPGRTVYARVWKVQVGRIDLYLLDSDMIENLPEDRSITHQLYGGDWENRFKQELLLGIGGIRMLRELGIKTEIYHCNEGHAAFIGVERLREFINEDNLSFAEALEVVRASSLFTTHTPVPAGHDAFSEDMLRKYLSHYPERLRIDWAQFMALGKNDPYNTDEKFSMSILASRLSEEINGVSWLHGKVSQDILAHLWPGYLPQELDNVGFVTNGVHYPTWTAPEWKVVHAKVFGDDFASHHYDKKCFDGIRKVKSSVIWDIRRKLKSKLIYKVKELLSNPSVTNHYAAQQIVTIKKTLRDDILTIGFARRFATYKRAHLLFRDLDRLDKIVNDPVRPVQFLFAGKAHPADKAGQDLIKHIVEISKLPQFIGKIVFIPNYDITIAKYLVQGVDIWMNTPTRPLEASGTSGEKAVMNGVMHFSVLDGWWVEGYKEGAGWALPMERTYDNQDFQDDLDAATIYNLIETDIASKYYDKGNDGISEIWIETIKNCVAEVAANFTTNRMMEDYINKYYNPQSEKTKSVSADNFAIAREIAIWKATMRKGWNSLEIISSSQINNASGALQMGNDYIAQIVIKVGEINPKDLGVEVIFAERDKKGAMLIKDILEYKLLDFKDGLATYQCDFVPEKSGAFLTAGRIYAKNPLLTHRQDFELVKWL